MEKCLIVAGGAVSASLLKSIFRREEFAYVFAVDRGLEALDTCGIRPTHLVGDFDSVAPEVLEKYLPGQDRKVKICCEGETHKPVDKAGIFPDTDSTKVNYNIGESVKKSCPILERLTPEKDDTDTEHAMRRAVSLQPDEIVLMGGFGTRFDHVLANVHTLTIPLRAGISACMVDGTNRVRLLGTENMCENGTDACLRIKKRDAWGKYVSLLPLTAEVTGITLDGFKYPLGDAKFKIGETVSLGVSNELTAEEGTIRVRTGILVVVESAD